MCCAAHGVFCEHWALDWQYWSGCVSGDFMLWWWAERTYFIYTCLWVSARAALCTRCKVKINRDAIFASKVNSLRGELWASKYLLAQREFSSFWLCVWPGCMCTNWLLMVCNVARHDLSWEPPPTPIAAAVAATDFSRSCKKQSGRCAASQNMAYAELLDVEVESRGNGFLFGSVRLWLFIIHALDNLMTNALFTQVFQHKPVLLNFVWKFIFCF